VKDFLFKKSHWLHCNPKKTLRERDWPRRMVFDSPRSLLFTKDFLNRTAAGYDFWLRLPNLFAILFFWRVEPVWGGQ